MNFTLTVGQAGVFLLPTQNADALEAEAVLGTPGPGGGDFSMLEGADLPDADVTIQSNAGNVRTLPVGTLTTDRVLTLSPTATAFDVIVVKRRDANVFLSYTIVDGGPGTPTLTNIGNGVGMSFVFDGTNWQRSGRWLLSP